MRSVGRNKPSGDVVFLTEGEVFGVGVGRKVVHEQKAAVRG